MEGIIDEEPVNQHQAATGGGGGPFTDMISQFQQQRQSGAGAGGYGGYGGYAAQQQQQQPVMDWGQGFGAAQQAAYANMTGYGAGLDTSTGADMDDDGGYAKRQRMQDQAMMAAMGGGGAPHTSSSTNQLQALGNTGWQQPAANNQLVEGTDLTQVYEQARAAQAQGYGAGLAIPMGGYGAGLMDNGYAETPINQLGPSDLQQQMMMQQQQQQHMQPGQYNMSGAGGRSRLEPIRGGYSSNRAPQAAPVSQGPSRLTTGHKHAEYLQNLVRARFNTAGGSGAAGGGMVTRSATNTHYMQQHGTSYPGYYSQYGMPHQEEDHAAEEADQVLSKCEAVSWAGALRLVWSRL